MTEISSRSSTLLQAPSCLGDGYFNAFEPGSAGDDWKIYVHPQGWIYFYNPSLRVLTDHDIRAPGMLEYAQKNYSKLPPELPDGLEVQLHLARQEGVEGATFNLMVNHSLCLASHNMDDIKNDRLSLLDPKTLNRARRLYWNYLWNHPVHVPLPSRAIDDASDALAWFYTDNLISGAKSIVPFSKSECDELSRIVRDLCLPNYERSVSKTVFLAWFLREVCSFRDAESWGLYTLKDSKDLRAARHHTKRLEVAYRPSRFGLALLNFVTNFLFFGIPHTYRAHIKMASQYQGRLANMQANWEKYIERLVREYSSFLLISTVLLSATVGVLAVPDIPEGSVVAATVSALAALGSIIIGVFSIWRHQANTRTADSFTYMHNVQHSLLGLYGHSLLLSLPPALLVWAIVSFSISIIIYVMRGVHGQGTFVTISSWIIFAVFVLLFMTVALALYTFAIIWKFHRPLPPFWLRLFDWGRGGQLA